MLVNEYLDEAEIQIRYLADLAELEGRLSDQWGARKIQGHGEIAISVEAIHQRIRWRIRGTGASAHVDVNLAEDVDWPPYVMALADNHALRAFVKIAERVPGKSPSVTGNIRLEKTNDPNLWHYEFFTTQGATAVQVEVVRRLIAGEHCPHIWLSTPLVPQTLSGQGVCVSPNGVHEHDHAQDDAMLFPTKVPSDLEQIFSRIQLALVARQVGVAPGVFGKASLADARQLKTWIDASPVRANLLSIVVRRNGKGAPHPVGALLSKLKRTETDLIDDAIREIEDARAIFQKELFDFLKDLQRMKSEVANLAAGDTFRLIIILGLTLAGAAFTTLEEGVVFGASAGLATLILMGAIVKSYANASEFKRLVLTNKDVLSSRAAGRLSELHQTFVSSHNGSVRSFYRVLFVGLLLLSLPLLGIITYASSVLWPEALRWTLVACGIAVVAYLGITFGRRPWQNLLIHR